MIELTDSQTEDLREIFSHFEQNDISYVIQHGYRDLPARIDGSDIDILISPRDFSTAVSICDKYYNTEPSRARNALNLFFDAVTSPIAVAQYLLNPDRLRRLLKQQVISPNSASVGSSAVSHRKSKYGTADPKGYLFEVENLLRYRDPTDEYRKITVDEDFCERILDSRVPYKFFYAPNSAGELAHLVSRGVCTYRGEFPAKHRTTCETLAEEVFADAELESEFVELLEFVFGDVTDIVINGVRAGEFDSIADDIAASSPLWSVGDHS